MRSTASVTIPLASGKRPEEEPQQVGAAPFPRLLITGSDEKLLAGVGRALQGLRVRIEILLWEEALEALSDGATAVVLVLPIRRIAMSTAVEIVRDHPNGKAIPVYCVVPEKTSSRRVRLLYSAGANVVLDWPREKVVFRDLFAESFGITRVRGRADEADKALGHSVRAHLRIFPELDAGRLRLFARNGLVSVSGRIRSLEQRRRIIETIAAVPGVRAVIAHSLRVESKGIADRTLKRRVRRLLKEASDLDDSTLLVKVRGGSVTIGGTVRYRAEIQRLEDLIIQLDGARALDLRLSVSPERQRADSRQSHRYRRALETLYPDERVSLTCINGTAVLTGTVRSLTVKRSIARLIERDSAVHEVVNKITVK